MQVNGRLFFLITKLVQRILKINIFSYSLTLIDALDTLLVSKTSVPSFKWLISINEPVVFLLFLCFNILILRVLLVKTA